MPYGWDMVHINNNVSATRSHGRTEFFVTSGLDGAVNLDDEGERDRFVAALEGAHEVGVVPGSTIALEGDASYLFSSAYCPLLERVEADKFDVSRVTNMEGMFEGCASLVELPVSRWDTRNVENMSRMFQGCSALVRPDTHVWDMRKVRDISFMFDGCGNAREAAPVRRAPYVAAEESQDLYQFGA
jgi:surface protein